MFYHIFLNKKIGEKERNRSLANKFIIFREKRSQNQKKKNNKCCRKMRFFNFACLFFQYYLSIYPKLFIQTVVCNRSFEIYLYGYQ